ncbi:MAG: hypothetical protein HY675_05145 [Chloroflexi bacterium]|nr:hypothetical protein [Chloroflexota bacterium]
MLRRWWNAWRGFARAMADFQTRILLGLFYFFVVMPFGAGVSAFGDPLGLKRRTSPSNWLARNSTTGTDLDLARKQY